MRWKELSNQDIATAQILQSYPSRWRLVTKLFSKTDVVELVLGAWPAAPPVAAIGKALASAFEWCLNLSSVSTDDSNCDHFRRKINEENKRLVSLFFHTTVMSPVLSNSFALEKKSQIKTSKFSSCKLTKIICGVLWVSKKVTVLHRETSV